MIRFLAFITRFRHLILPVVGIKWLLLHVWMITGWFGQGYHLAWWDGVVSNVLLVGITLALINLLVHYIPSEGKFWFALVLSVIFSGVWQWLVNEAMQSLATDDGAYQHFLYMSMPVRWCIGFLVMGGASVCSIFYNQVQEQLRQMQRKSDTEVLAREAELRKLQLQLQPHFLFNSLNSINAMILVRPAEARSMVEQLSEFLRITTRRADEATIQFGEEWRYVELYLAIEKVRFGHRLEVKSTLSEEALACTIPTLVLQPLVENAIKFGLYGTTDKIVISLDASVHDGLLTVRITNPFDSDMQPKQGSGFGLSGLKRRLYLLYARNDLLQTTAADNTFTVTLHIPVIA
jgi:two-component system LytT family sensor kinase